MKNTHERSGQDRNPKKITTSPKSDVPKKDENVELTHKPSKNWEEESGYILPISENRRKLSRDEFLYDDEEE